MSSSSTRTRRGGARRAAMAARSSPASNTIPPSSRRCSAASAASASGDSPEAPRISCFDLVARHGLDCGCTARHLDPGHPFGKGGGARAAARGRLDKARRAGRIPRRRASCRRRRHRLLYRRIRGSPGRGLAAVVVCARVGARGARRGGAHSSPARGSIKLDVDGAGWRAVTATGATVRADTVLVATNAYADGIVPGLARSIVALNSLQIATAPLPAALRRTLLPERRNALRHAQGDPLLEARRRGSPADGRSRPLSGSGFGARLEPSRA